jgi:hypothetical protein
MNMITQSNSRMRWIAATLCILFGLTLFLAEAEAQRRGGGSFGGSRRSSPSYAPSRPSAPSSSMQRSGGSFGGSRSMSPAAGSSYRSSYGIPRQSAPVSVPGASSPYMVHSYGGYTDGLMMGYLMGRTSAMWYTPFHPAFYYSRPVYVNNPDGTMEVYPPTFSFFRLFLGLAVLGLIVWLVMRFFRRRAGVESGSQSSFA